MYDQAELLRGLARMQHPILAAIYPWIVGLSYASFAVIIILLMRAKLLRGQDREQPIVSLLIGLAAFVVIMVLAVAVDPSVTAQARLGACCPLSMVPLGLLAIREIRYDRSSYYENGWNFRPFRYLLFLPIATLAVLLIIGLVNTVMTIPAYVTAIPPHIKAVMSQIVALLNHLSRPEQSALIIGAILLAFFRELTKFVKTLVTR